MNLDCSPTWLSNICFVYTQHVVREGYVRGTEDLMPVGEKEAQDSNVSDRLWICPDLQVFAMTAPLITTSDGKKMGKSEGGAMWLNEDMLPPYDYWQFWRNTNDDDVGR